MTSAGTPAPRGPAPTRSSAASPTLSAARSRILEHLQQVGAPASADEVAEVFSAHPNTVREHLDGLVDSGLVLRERVLGGGRGRPPWRYRADRRKTEPDSRVRHYGALAAALASQLAATAEPVSAGSSTPPVSSAPTEAPGLGRAAGREWAHILPEVSAPAPDATPREALVELLTELGFAPRPVGGGPQLELLRCPLLDAARAQPAVICAVHEGMISETLEMWGEPPSEVTLLPFATAQGCLLSWTTAPAG